MGSLFQCSNKAPACAAVPFRSFTPSFAKDMDQIFAILMPVQTVSSVPHEEESWLSMLPSRNARAKRVRFDSTCKRCDSPRCDPEQVRIRSEEIARTNARIDKFIETAKAQALRAQVRVGAPCAALQCSRQQLTSVASLNTTTEGHDRAADKSKPKILVKL